MSYPTGSNTFVQQGPGVPVTTTTTTTYGQPQLQGQTTTWSVAGQPATGQPYTQTYVGAAQAQAQPVTYATVPAPVQVVQQHTTFSVQGRRGSRAQISCCGHTTVWTVLGIALAMVIAGSILVGIFSHDVRGDRIVAYNEYVESWAPVARELELSSTELSVEATLMCEGVEGNYGHYVSMGTNSFALDKTTSFTDELEDSRTVGSNVPLPLEPQLKFYNASTFTNIREGGKLCYLDISFFQQLGGSGSRELVKSVSSRLVETRTFTCNDNCQQSCFKEKYGSSMGKVCFYPMTLKDVCIKVDEVARPGGQPKLEVNFDFPAVKNEDDSTGCYYSRNHKSFVHSFRKNVRPRYDATDYEVGFYVRYSRDAWLGYMRVTENSGYFGVDNGPPVSTIINISSSSSSSSSGSGGSTTILPSTILPSQD